MADAFIEVDEQLRVARIQTMFRRGWPAAAGLLALVAAGALGVWGWRTYDVAAQGKASATYGQAIAALGAGQDKAADDALATLVKDAPPTFKSMALMQEAALKLKADDAQGAAALFDQAAAAAHDKVTVDSARLRAAYALMDSAAYDAIRARLLPLADKGRPFHALAREALAVEEMATGRLAEAKGDFQVLALSPDVSDATRARANAALAMIASGAAVNMQQIARAATGLKPAPPKPQGMTLTPEQAAALAQAQAQAQAQAGQSQGAAPAGAEPQGATPQGATPQPAQGQPSAGAPQ